MPISAEMATAMRFDADTIRAYAQKDKLLMFDREHAKRTQVHDAQSDYYESSTWLTEEEKREIDEKQRKKKEKRERRPLPKIAFDMAGRRMVAHGEDQEGENEAANAEALPSCAAEWDELDFENTNLALGGSRAGDIYRQMRDRYAVSPS